MKHILKVSSGAMDRADCWIFRHRRSYAWARNISRHTSGTYFSKSWINSVYWSANWNQSLSGSWSKNIIGF